MPAWTRTTTSPGDRVVVEIGYSDRTVLRPLIGKLRTVEVIDDQRALIHDEHGRRYRFDGRIVPPVHLAEASIFTDPQTGQLWAQTYDLPTRDPSPYPLPDGYAAVAEPDGQGGIAQMPSCRCGNSCRCPACGARTLTVAHGLDWADVVPGGTWHSGRMGCQPPACPSASDFALPDCCALPMRLAPVGWVCRRDSAHRRTYRWPESAVEHSAVDNLDDEHDDDVDGEVITVDFDQPPPAL
jgi:hypothetical protein